MPRANYFDCFMCNIWYKKYCLKGLPLVVFIIAKRWKQLQCPWTDEQISKQNMVYTYSGIPLSLKKARIPREATTWMNLEDHMPSGISQPQEDKYCMILQSEDKNKWVMLVLYVRENKPWMGEYRVSPAVEHSCWGIWVKNELHRALEDPCRGGAFDWLGCIHDRI